MEYIRTKPCSRILSTLLWLIIILAVDARTGSSSGHYDRRINSRHTNNNNHDNNNEFSFVSIQKQPRIVGGIPAQPGQYPFFVKTVPPTLCGGTLIASDIVLTAAHCEDAFRNGITIGGILLDGTDAVEQLDVTTVFPHPDYMNGTTTNDIMLVKLAEPSTLSPVVELNFESSIPVTNEVVTVIGFGDTSEEGDPSQELMTVNVNVFPEENCTILQGFDLGTQICAGTVEGGRDSCQGDSGGPLLTTDNVQVGVVSSGSGCGRPDIPAIYTKVSSFETFIRQGICDLSNDPPSDCPSVPPVDTPVTPPIDTAAPSPAPAVANPVIPPVNAPNTATPTNIPIDVPINPPTNAGTSSPTITFRPTITAQPTITMQPTMDSTNDSPTLRPIAQPTNRPIIAPTNVVEPTLAPTPLDDVVPTLAPAPSGSSNSEPTLAPTPGDFIEPTLAPIPIDNVEPTIVPTPVDIVEPAQEPTVAPTSHIDTEEPTQEPNIHETEEPTIQSTFDEINPPRGKGMKYGKGGTMMGKGKSGGMMKGYDKGGMMMSMGKGKGSMMRKSVHYGKGIMYHENVLFRNDDDDNDISSENNLLTLIQGPSL